MKKYRIKTVEELKNTPGVEVEFGHFKIKECYFNDEMRTLCGEIFEAESLPTNIDQYHILDWMCVEIPTERGKFIPKKGEIVKCINDDGSFDKNGEFLFCEPRLIRPCFVMIGEGVFTYKHVQQINPKPIYTNPIGQEFFEGDVGYYFSGNSVRSLSVYGDLVYPAFKTKKALFQYLADKED